MRLLNQAFSVADHQHRQPSTSTHAISSSNHGRRMNECVGLFQSVPLWRARDIRVRRQTALGSSGVSSLARSAAVSNELCRDATTIACDSGRDGSGVLWINDVKQSNQTSDRLVNNAHIACFVSGALCFSGLK